MSKEDHTTFIQWINNLKVELRQFQEKKVLDRLGVENLAYFIYLELLKIAKETT